MSKIAPNILQKLIKELQSDTTDKVGCHSPELYHNSADKGLYIRYTYTKIYSDCAGAIYRWLCFNAEGKRVDCDPDIQDQSAHDKFWKNMVFIQKIEL